MENPKTSTKDKIRVMVAYIGGASIQQRDRRINGVWSEVYQPSWDWNTYEYRINPIQAMFVKDINGILTIDAKIDVNITKVIFNKPATIVFWSDGTKTVVKCENEPYDPEKGLAMTIAKKCFGNTGKYYEIFKKLIPEEDNYIEFTVDHSEDQEYHVPEDAKSLDNLLSLEG